MAENRSIWANLLWNSISRQGRISLHPLPRVQWLFLPLFYVTCPPTPNCGVNKKEKRRNQLLVPSFPKLSQSFCEILECQRKATVNAFLYVTSAILPIARQNAEQDKCIKKLVGKRKMFLGVRWVEMRCVVYSLAIISAMKVESNTSKAKQRLPKSLSEAPMW